MSFNAVLGQVECEGKINFAFRLVTPKGHLPGGENFAMKRLLGELDTPNAKFRNDLGHALKWISRISVTPRVWLQWPHPNLIAQVKILLKR